MIEGIKKLKVVFPASIGLPAMAESRFVPYPVLGPRAKQPPRPTSAGRTHGACSRRRRRAAPRQQRPILPALCPTVNLPCAHHRQGVAERPGLCVPEIPPQGRGCGLVVAPSLPEEGVNAELVRKGWRAACTGERARRCSAGVPCKSTMR